MDNLAAAFANEEILILFENQTGTYTEKSERLLVEIKFEIEEVDGDLELSSIIDG